jgi:hypothetical protein
MRTFEKKPQITQQTTIAKSMIPLKDHFGHSQAKMVDDSKASRTDENAGFGQDFSHIPIVPSEQSAAKVSGNNHSDMRPMVTHQRQTFSAEIRRASPAAQHDSMNKDEPLPALASETPTTQSKAISSGQPSLDSEEEKTVLFPSSMFEAIALPGQSDAIASALAYKSDINPVAPPANPGGFGETLPVYRFEAPGPRATQSPATRSTPATFNVTGTIIADITYWVAGGTRTDIASDNDPDITQTNYTDVVKDLTPSPAAVNTGGMNLYKNQPPRKKFWAADLTIKHEKFHADEDVTYGQEGVTLAQNWLNRQTAKDYDEVGALLNRINPIVSRHVDTKMALPGRENRAYNHGAPDYTARAQAVKTKGDAKGYVPKPPAPKAPVTPPTTPPKAQGAPTPTPLIEPEVK